MPRVPKPAHTGLHIPSLRRSYPVTGHFFEGPSYRITRTHGSDDWLLIFTVAGRGWFRHAQGQWIAEAGNVALMSPNHIHGYGTEGPHWELLWCHFVPPGHWLDLLDWPKVGPGMAALLLRDPAITRRAMSSLTRMDRLAGSAHQRREQLAMNALEAALLWCLEEHPESRMARYDERLRRVIEHVTEHLQEPLDVQLLAEVAKLSPSRFAHLFRQQIGKTPQQFVEQHRMLRARQLLERTAMPISEVAEAVGFDQAFYFSRRFRASTGLSPRAYRQRYA